MQPRTIFIFAAVALLWGSEWLLTASLADIPRFRLLALRCLIAAIALSSSVLRKPRSTIPLSRNIALGAIVIALPALFLAFCTGLSPGLIVLLFATMPILTSIFEGAGLSQAPALLGGLAGTAFLVRGGLSLSLTQALPALGLLIVITAVSALLVRAKPWLQNAHLASCVMLQMLTAAVLFGAYSIVREGPLSWHLHAGQLIALLTLAILAGSVAYSGFYYLLRVARASQVTSVQWLIPFVAIMQTAISLRHWPTWDSAAGGLLATASAFFLLHEPPDSSEPLTLQITTGSDTGNVPPREPGR